MTIKGSIRNITFKGNIGREVLKERRKKEGKKGRKKERKKERKNGGFPGGTVVKNLPANGGAMGSSPGPGRYHMSQSN